MSLLYHIDNEVPVYGEWDAVFEAGGSTIVQSADAAFPERGAVGLRLTTAAGDAAYAQKTVSASIPAGGDYYIGFWFRMRNPGGNYVGIVDTEEHEILAYMRSTRLLNGYFRNDAGGYAPFIQTQQLALNQWYWLVFRLHRAATSVSADGYGAIYVDGALAATTANMDNFHRAEVFSWLRIGASINIHAGMDADFDEIKIATTYPEPFVPTPLTEYPEARRTVVLFRQASADSFAFADYCVSELGVPRSNLCPLPNATANETLADYATFETEVEDDLTAWLALNPTVAANCSCFLLACGVPGYFTSGGVKHSAVSRLMNYGTVFSSQTDNPLYNPATVARLTKTGLGGKYLCTRIDADTLQHSKDVLDAGLAVSGLSVLPATDKIFSDETTYLASLSAQHLRIITAALGTFANDAFVWGDCGTPAFGAAGSRACFTDDSADSADTLRATSELFDAIVTNLYAAGLGFSSSPDSLVPGPFFEMLRIGGTFAEALAVAVAHLDYTAVGVGSPVMTVAFGEGGYNVYRGVGGIEDIDWNNPVAYLRIGQDSIAFDQDLLPGQRYIYAVRTVSPAGAEERNTQVITYVETDEQGNLLPAPLARPTDLVVDVQQISLLIGFSYCAPLGFSEADGFDVLSDNGTGQLDLDNPVATVERSQNGQFDFETSITRPGVPVLLTVRAREVQRTGPISEILFVPLSDAPAPTQIL